MYTNGRYYIHGSFARTHISQCYYIIILISYDYAMAWCDFLFRLNARSLSPSLCLCMWCDVWFIFYLSGTTRWRRQTVKEYAFRIYIFFSLLEWLHLTGNPGCKYCVCVCVCSFRKVWEKQKSRKKLYFYLYESPFPYFLPSNKSLSSFFFSHSLLLLSFRFIWLQN